MQFKWSYSHSGLLNSSAALFFCPRVTWWEEGGLADGKLDNLFCLQGLQSWSPPSVASAEVVNRVAKRVGNLHVGWCSTRFHQSIKNKTNEFVSKTPLQLAQITVSQDSGEPKVVATLYLTWCRRHLLQYSAKCKAGHGNMSNLRKHLVKHKICQNKHTINKKKYYMWAVWQWCQHEQQTTVSSSPLDQAD